MAVVRILVHGTREEIAALLQVLPASQTDRRLWGPKPIYQHMIKQLGFDIYDLCISKRSLTMITVEALEKTAEQYPNMLYEVRTGKWGDVVTYAGKRMINYDSEDMQYPGPFGALCKRYGKTFWTRPIGLVEANRLAATLPDYTKEDV